MGYIILLNMTKELWFSLIIGVSLLFVIIVVASYILINRRRKQTTLDIDYLNSISKALGDFKNIISTNLEQQRLQIKVNDTKMIDAEFFKNEKIPAFISGNKITVLFKEHAKEIFQFLASKGA